MSSILFELDTEVHDGLTVRGFAVLKERKAGLETILEIPIMGKLISKFYDNKEKEVIIFRKASTILRKLKLWR